MKTALLLLFSFFSLPVFAQSKDEIEVAAAVEALRQALISGSENELKAIAAEELSYGHSNGKVENKKEFMESLVSGGSDFRTIQLSDQTVSIVADIAIVRHKLIAETMDEGKPGNPNLSVLLIWQKQKGKWKLLARQATRLVN
jgi:hypothetical protein